MPIAPEAPVELVPYDARWPALFSAERVRLLSVLRPWLAGPVEHVGSTAVPGMPAKPIIDIMAAVASLDASRSATPALVESGYHYAPYRADVMHWFCKPSFAERSHHLHLVPFGSALWHDRITFRDCLRSHPVVAQEYAVLKDRLAQLHRLDREAYTEAKGPFVAQVLKRFSSSTP